VVVHHSNCLHERVADGWADEPEASPAEFFAHSVGLFGGRRNLSERAEPVPDWAAAYKPPHVFVEGTEFFPHCHELSSIRDRRFDLETVTYDSGIGKQTLDVSIAVTDDSRRVKAMECFAVVFTLVENCLPRESCLGTLECEKLEQSSVVVYWDSPFFVVVLNHKLIIAEARPVTSPNESLLQLAPLLNDPLIGGKVTLINHVGVALDI